MNTFSRFASFAGLLLVAAGCTLVERARAVEIAFAGMEDAGSGAGNLYALREDGSRLRRLTAHARTAAFSPAWSPDRSRLAYIALPLEGDGSPRFGEATVNVVESDGSRDRQLVRPAAVEPLPRTVQRPAWSADGRVLLYTRGEPPPEGWTLSTVTIDKATAVNTGGGDLTLGSVTGSWSADGRILVVAGFSRGGSTGIGYSYVDEPIYHQGLALSDSDGGRDPVVSADGNWVAWWGWRYDRVPHVYLRRTDAATGVVDLGEGVGPVWSPNAPELLFTAGPR